MLLTSLAIAFLPLQACSLELPYPGSQIGEELAASSEWVASTGGFFERSLFVWRRTPMALTDFEAELTPASGGRIFDFDVAGDRIVMSAESTPAATVHVWERDSSGNWIEGPALSIPGSRRAIEPVFIAGNTVVATTVGPGGGGQRRIGVWDRNSSTGAFDFSEEVLPFGNGPLSLESLADGRIVAADGLSGARSLRILERSGTGFSLAASIDLGSSTSVSGSLAAGGDRIAIPRRSFAPASSWVDVYARTAGSWSLEQQLPSPVGFLASTVALGDGWLAVRHGSLFFGSPTPQPIQIYRRLGSSSVWSEIESVTPVTGFTGSSNEWGNSLSIADGALFTTDANNPSNMGQVVEVDLSCLRTKPALHWVPAQLELGASPGWPAAGEPLVVSTALPFNVGRTFGLRNASIEVQADYEMDILGLPCSSDYSTDICAFGAYSLVDSVSGVATSPFPIDPNSGAPQLYVSGRGPTVSASSVEVTIPWSFSFTTSDSLNVSIPPTGRPLGLELFAQSYNCVDLGGQWFASTPHVTGSQCNYQLLPTTVTSLDFTALVTGEIAVELPTLAPGLQGTICDGGINDTQGRATLEAVGSTRVADNALFVQVSGIAPGRAGLLFLSPIAATPPFAPLGFGSLCLGTPLVRAPGSLAVADSAGQVSSRIDLAELPMAAQPQPGSTWSMQWMYRDQGFVNTSSARTVTFQ